MTTNVTDLGSVELDKFFDHVKNLVSAKETLDILEIGADLVGVEIEGLVQDAKPSRRHEHLPYFYMLDGRPSKFKSAKQRRFVMAMAAKGNLTYVRSNFLTSSFTHVVMRTRADVQLKVGSKVPYGPYVIGEPDVQNHFLGSLGWEPVVTTINSHSVELKALLANAVWDELIKRAPPP